MSWMRSGGQGRAASPGLRRRRPLPVPLCPWLSLLSGSRTMELVSRKEPLASGEAEVKDSVSE